MYANYPYPPRANHKFKALRKIAAAFQRYWFKTALALLLTTALVRRDLSLNVQWTANHKEPVPAPKVVAEVMPMYLGEEPPLNVSLIHPGKKEARAVPAKMEAKSPEPAPNPTPAVAPTVVDPDKQKRKETYVRKYAQIAQAEMERYGIPASVTLAQGLLETDAGASPLASTANNHFGIKCFSKSCRRGHCRNFEDDSHKDFFRIYPSAWESYRAHSILLQAPRYKGLYKLPKKDYGAWARGLKEAGYATDPHYPEKLIRLIEDMKLHRYDN